MTNPQPRPKTFTGRDLAPMTPAMVLEACAITQKVVERLQAVGVIEGDPTGFCAGFAGVGALTLSALGCPVRPTLVEYAVVFDADAAPTARGATTSMVCTSDIADFMPPYLSLMAEDGVDPETIAAVAQAQARGPAVDLRGPKRLQLHVVVDDGAVLVDFTLPRSLSGLVPGIRPPAIGLAPLDTRLIHYAARPAPEATRAEVAREGRDLLATAVRLATASTSRAPQVQAQVMTEMLGRAVAIEELQQAGDDVIGFMVANHHRADTGGIWHTEAIFQAIAMAGVDVAAARDQLLRRRNIVRMKTKHGTLKVRPPEY